MEVSVVRGVAVEAISDRLSSLEDLYFPRAVQSAASFGQSERRAALCNLLSKDPVIFLERYGTRLTDDELQFFDPMKGNYEIDWHLSRIRSSRRPPTAEETRFHFLTVKNRRRAYLNELIRGGEYFSEESMREREPYLHHEYVGKFHDPVGRSMSRPGERWSDTLMRRSDEAILLEKIRTEKERLGISDADEAGSGEADRDTEDEVEEDDGEGDDDDDDDDDDDTDDSECMKVGGEEDSHGGDSGSLPAVEIEDGMEQFTYIMQQKFLAGEDTEHLDYSRIDNDESLDDHWQREVNQDAEEKYFADD